MRIPDRRSREDGSSLTSGMLSPASRPPTPQHDGGVGKANVAVTGPDAFTVTLGSCNYDVSFHLISLATPAKRGVPVAVEDC
jgi:hypothetical protein